MTLLQNTGICWYANKITEVSFFFFTKRVIKPLSGSKQKIILKLLTYILRQWGLFYAFNIFYFCSSHQWVNILKVKLRSGG